jgi:trehalose 6-phosphate synthase
MTARKAAQAGGVAVVLSDVMRATRGLWFGWSGEIRADPAVSIATDERGVTLATLPMTRDEHDGFYLGYSNSVLWPVFHNRLDLARFDPSYFETYAAFNCKVAAALAPLLRRDDVIWVHDYHFMLLAQELRKLRVRNRIGFFLHVTMPPPEAYLAIPEHREISAALSAYNLIGLQTAHDVTNALRCLYESVGAQCDDGTTVRAGYGTTAIDCFPIGIDAGYFAPRKADPAVEAGNAIRILGVDRLDYSKGLPQKFSAFQHFLEKYPGHKRKVVLTQIAAPTRESVGAYKSIRKELESLSGSINGAHGDLDWVPVQYIHRAIARRKLGEIYRSAKVALVTPLCDGMNLMAKEYVASQHPADPGVLVLSKFAGAAEQLNEALLVNPHNADEIADALHQALTMDLEERKYRHAAMLKIIQSQSSEMWFHSFVDRLRRETPDKARRSALAVMAP